MDEAAPATEGGSFLRAAGVSTAENGHAGIAGEKIGEGAFSKAYAWAPGQMVKLFKAGVSRQFGLHEARMIRAVFAAGLPVPEVFGEVTLDGRFGIVMQRLDGPTLWHLSRTGVVTFERAGAIVAALAMSLHKTSPPPEVLSMREYMESELRHDDGRVPKHIATDVLALIDRLSPGDGLCHCDLSPGNVIMTAKGPKLVDWSFAMRAPRHRARVLACHPFRTRPGNSRQSGASARDQCGGAIRIRAAGRHVARGACGGHGAVFAHRPHLRRPRRRGAFLAGAADSAHRNGAALGRLNRPGRARQQALKARQCLLWVTSSDRAGPSYVQLVSASRLTDGAFGLQQANRRHSDERRREARRLTRVVKP